MLNFNSGRILFLLNHFGALLADHHGRGVGVAGRDVGHNRSIGDAQVFDSVDSQFRIHDRFSVDTLAGLRRLQARGELKLDGEWSPLQNAAAFEDWLQPLESIQCVTYIQAPPTPDTSPDQVLKYLARYMTGGPISDRRLLRHEHGHVTFSARKGTQAGGDADDVEEVTLPGVEFVRRGGQHVLQEAVGCVSTHRSDANSSGRKTRKWCVKTHPTELTWNGSTNSNLQQYEIRVSSGATYDAGTASVAGQVLAGTEEFRTTQELLAPGDTATFKVYVILTTGNEAGSNTVSITRM
jgi:hypothetical protein